MGNLCCCLNNTLQKPGHLYTQSYFNNYQNINNYNKAFHTKPLFNRYNNSYNS